VKWIMFFTQRPQSNSSLAHWSFSKKLRTRNDAFFDFRDSI